MELDTEVLKIFSNLFVKRTRNKTCGLSSMYVQEKLIKGGFSFGSAVQKMRKQRAITSIKKDLDYNQRLWRTASRYH